jgi:hypothetical protein
MLKTYASLALDKSDKFIKFLSAVDVLKSRAPVKGPSIGFSANVYVYMFLTGADKEAVRPVMYLK